MKIRQYRLLSDSKIEPKAVAGTIVYGFTKCDYGLASDDTRITGIEHRSVTLNSEGDYPSFTHPVNKLEEIKEGV
ncbi:hypothetical protein D3C80_1299660 [compost metagenome]